MAVGEEDANSGRKTTMRLGEEGGRPRQPSLTVGEGNCKPPSRGGMTTMAIGEEGGAPKKPAAKKGKKKPGFNL